MTSLGNATIILRIDLDWEPRPGVVLSPFPLEHSYPTRPGTLAVIEVPLKMTHCRRNRCSAF
jgi:hypothetical protein